ncbi:MAG: ATP-binding cassette domain-containing protein, partial [Actinobacteria bacterium]|nr:ATP-binding cassette domain-containing protein [Actinomycetota bacterium]
MNSFYVINLLVYAAVDAMACLGLSQQFGVAGVTNFGFIIFQAAGGYAAAIMALPPDTANGGFQSYLGGWGLPFPLPWIGAAVVGGVIALPFTFLVGRRLRGDFAAVGLLVTAVLLNLLATDYRPLLNGDAGLSLIPQPLQPSGAVASAGSQWMFTVIAIALAAAVFWFVRRVTESPYGRSLRAMRDNDAVADSLGKNLLSLRTVMLVAGGAIAGLSGGVLVTYITTWSPAAWGYAETVVLFAAVIIGGAGNHWGAVLGAVLVPVGFEEVTRYIPTSNNLPPNLIPSLEWVAIGILIVVFLWWRPQGILPERKRVIRVSQPPTATADPISGSAPAHVPSAGWQESSPAETVGPEAPEDDGERAQRDARGPARPPSPSVTDDGRARPPSPSVTDDGSSPAPGLAPSPQPGPAPGPAPESDGAPAGASIPPAPTPVSRGGSATSPREAAPILEVRGVVREFGGVRAVDEASFVVRRGSLTGLIGPNGAGKSTLLAMLAGTLPVTSGRVMYQGQDVTSLAAFRRARLGLVRTFQLASEFKRLTVMENLLSAVPG